MIAQGGKKGAQRDGSKRGGESTCGKPGPLIFFLGANGRGVIDREEKKTGDGEKLKDPRAARKIFSEDFLTGFMSKKSLLS